MADHPRTDDESAGLPEVTVPPWLRSGPTPDQALPTPPGAARSGTEGAAAGRTPRADRAAPPGPSVSAPNRITLDARTPADPPGTQEARYRENDLSTLPLRVAPGPGSAPAATPHPEEIHAPGPVATSSPGGGRSPKGPVGGAAPCRPAPGRPAPGWLAVMATAGLAVLAGSGVLGYLLARGGLAPSGGQAADCVAVEEPGRVVGAGPGSLDTPAGAVLAFDHAYYVERSAAKAFEAVSRSSRMSQERLRTAGVEQVAEGTTHCVEATELSPTLLDVTVTEQAPGAEPVHIRQRIRVAENPDGTWGIVSITPAG